MNNGVDMKSLNKVFKEIYKTGLGDYVTLEDYQIHIRSGEVYKFNQYIGDIKDTQIIGLQGKLELLYKLFKV